MNTVVKMNAADMFVTLDVSQVPMGWLNLLWSKIPCKLVTLDVFQVPIGWLKAFVRENILFMSVTLTVFQPEMFWLNFVAP